MKRRPAVPVSALAGLALAGAAATLIAGCRPVPPSSTSVAPSAGRETVITEEDIARMSVLTAWDVVRMRAPRFVAGQDANGRTSGVRIQEQRSAFADETPLLVVDRMQMADLEYLTQIPASQVHAIRVLDAEAAEPLYGLRAAGGAIVVEIKRTM
jgi:hypothetical protein